MPTVLAIELPPSGSVAQIQTNGPNALLDHGDWYTSRSPDAGGPGYHSFEIYVPCTVPAGQVITVELFDPESNNTGAGDLDEIMGASSDNTTFTLTNPSGSVAATTTYTPGGGTSQSWVIFTTFTPGANGCGIYRLTTTTSDNDEQGWKLRVTPDNPDGTPGTGDEISLGTLETSFQHTGFGCQTFHFFVPITLSIRLSNFDMDNAGTVTYTTPSANHPNSTVSGNGVWNSSSSYTYPPPGGDEISNPESGWWQATLCVDSGNQYVFDTGGLPYFYEKPATPDMAISKDDGTVTFNPDGVLTYTITYANNGSGAALDATLTDTLPLSTTFLSCSGGLSCGETPPGSGIVIFRLGTIGAGASGFVTVSVRVDPGAPAGTITNTVELDYSDIVFSDYPVQSATDVDQYEQPPPNPGLELAKTVYLGHDSGAGCPGGEIVTGTIGADVTYCFEVTNIGNTYLDDIVITDTLLGIPPAAVVLRSGSTPLAPGASLVYYYEATLSCDLVNTAEVEGNPTDPGGNDLPGVDRPTADDQATVHEVPEEEAPEPEPPGPEPPGPESPEVPTLTPTPQPTPTPNVLTVAMLPETGAFPEGYAVVLKMFIIGVASLIGLILMGITGWHSDGEKD